MVRTYIEPTIHHRCRVLTSLALDDGQPKPIAFPDPATIALRGGKIALLPLPRYVELTLASGMTAPHRLHDLADVLNLIRSTELPASFSEDLHPYVRPKFDELWHAAQTRDPYE